MQLHDPQRSTPERGSRELWASRLLLLVAQVAVVVALAYFVVMAWGMRGRISIPAWVIQAATLFAAGFGIYLLVRSIRLARVLFRRGRAR